ncbi:hypothetical protein [Algoriphagus sp. CAU 1675]|uniref:hypothetical protein n=1 Tax=Algoriphagus sp. CAU 1675 TaxID=3032597 RepID=UPI0023DA17AD|nr:hypothetical protein [Algoriphagus sp. CAU 1675]MDF2159113.1 hypothetical protein [Algoriphagus sp. CAU 1675]
MEIYRSVFKEQVKESKMHELLEQDDLPERWHEMEKELQMRLREEMIVNYSIKRNR